MAATRRLLVLVVVFLMVVCLFAITAHGRKRGKKKSKNAKDHVSLQDGLKFERPVYAEDIREDVPVGTIVATVTAVSGNEGKIFILLLMFCIYVFCKALYQIILNSAIPNVTNSAIYYYYHTFLRTWSAVVCRKYSR